MSSLIVDDNVVDYVHDDDDGDDDNDVHSTVE